MTDPRTVNPMPTIRHLPAHSSAARVAEAEPPDCYRSDERLGCQDGGCAWRRDCLRLVAAWKR